MSWVILEPAHVDHVQMYRSWERRAGRSKFKSIVPKKMDLWDAGFVATQIGVAGAGAYDLYKGYKHFKGTSAPLMSGRVVTPSTLNSKRRFLRGYQKQRRGFTSRRRLNFGEAEYRKQETDRPETAVPTVPNMPATHAKSRHRRTKYAGKMNQANIGMPLGFRQTKRNVESKDYCKSGIAGINFGDKFLFGDAFQTGDPAGTVRPVPLIRVPWNAATEKLDTRSTKFIGHRGIKLDMVIRRQPGATLPITLHYAVLTDRQGDIGAVAPNSTIKEKFFLAQEATDGQTQNFVDSQGRFWTYSQPLNPRQNNVVLHGKVNVGISDSGAAADLQMKMMARRRVYIKTRKQLEFENLDANPGSDLPKQNFYMVWWFYVKNSPIVGNEIPGGTNVNIPELLMRVTNYWSKSNMYS